MAEAARGVHVIATPTGTNAVLIQDEAQAWWLLDPGCAADTLVVLAAVSEVIGDDRPAGILLSHGHWHVAGGASELAKMWGCSVYCSAAEAPMVHGRIPYPPVDTTCHGIEALRAKFKAEPAPVPVPAAICFDGSSSIPGWEILSLPGHTPGSVGFFRPVDGVLLAGDALSTIDWDQIIPMWRQTKQLRMPPNIDTLDWVAVRRSLRLIASKKPEAVIPAHGDPLLDCAHGVSREAWHLAEVGIVARKGRYVADPAVLRSDNTWQLYDPIPDPVGKYGKLAVLAGIAVYVFLIIRLW